jgi:lactoylglutathione lyase
MKIDHIAIWTHDLERLRDFYVKFFNGRSNQKYHNPTTGFESFFVSFESGCRLELMKVPDLEVNNPSKINRTGIAHIAFHVDFTQAVDAKADELSAAGFPILKGPRMTGDGYYEFETLDVDGNQLEVTAFP